MEYIIYGLKTVESIKQIKDIIKVVNTNDFESINS